MEPKPDSPDRRALPLSERSLLTVQDLLASLEGLVDRAEEAARRASEVRANLAGPRVLDARGAARYLALGLDTLYRLVREGEIPHARVGKSIRFRPEDLDAYLASRTTRTWSRVDRRGRPRNGGAVG